MKTKISSFVKTAWSILTEVPGWPDAPFTARASRALPIFFPLLVCGALLAFQLLYLAPRIKADAEHLQPLTTLDQEVSQLESKNSEAELAQLKDRISTSERLLVSSSNDLPGLLQDIKSDLKKQGWDATLQAADVSDEALSPGALVSYLPVRARLKPTANNSEPFSSFVAVLERLSNHPKRIDLTRVVIRADDTRWQTVEANLRFACPVQHAKTIQ